MKHHAFTHPVLDEFNQQNGIIHHHPGQGNEADHAGQGEIQPHDEMAPDGANERQRNIQQHDKRLTVVSELQTQQ